MTYDVDRWMKSADPAAHLPLRCEAAARDLMRSIPRGTQAFFRLRLAAFSTVALVAVGGGVAVAAPAVHDLFYPETSVREVAVVSEGATTVQCTSKIETSIKLGDLKQHRATVNRWHLYAQNHNQTIRVPADSTRLQISVAVGRAGADLIKGFNRDHPSQQLQDAADVFTTIRCDNMPAR